MTPRSLRAAALVAALTLALGSCTWLAGVLGGTPSAQTQTNIVHGVLAACQTYKLSLEAAIIVQNAHKFSDIQVAEIKAVRPGIEAICPPNGAMPTNLTSALVTIAEGTSVIVSNTKQVQP